MLRTLFFCFAATLVCAQEFSGAPGSEQWRALYNPPYSKPTEIPREQGLRKDLFDLLRPKMERLAKADGIKFQGELKSYKNWAFFMGSVLDSNDRAIRFDPSENTDAAALWLHTKDGWKLVDYAVGFSDPFYWQWAEQYGVPRSLLGMEPGGR